MTRPFILGLKPSVDTASLSMNERFRCVGENCGNLAFTHAIHAHLGGNIPSFEWLTPIELLHQAGTPAIFPGANQLSAHCDLSEIAEHFKQITMPIVAIGMGAQSTLRLSIPNIPKGTMNFIRCLADHAPSDSPNISVRGSFTMDVLDHLGLAAHATILGCPSLFINPTPILGREVAGRLRTPERIAVTAGYPGWPHLKRIEASLAQLVTETNGSYIGQEPLEMTMLTNGLAESIDFITLRKYRDYINPSLEIPDFVNWSVRHGNVFFDVQSWIEHYKRFDFVIGTRIHGTILGLQAGVPSLCIAHDSRTWELCETLKIPYVLIDDVPDGIKRDDLISLFNFDPDEFDRNRRSLCRRYVQFLWSNGLVPVKWLEDIANYWEEETVFSSQGRALTVS